jgi:hypothetical protein
VLTPGGARTRGLQMSQDWDWDKKQFVFAFLGTDGIFTSVNDGYILDISLIYLGYMWRIYCCKLFKIYI